MALGFAVASGPLVVTQEFICPEIVQATVPYGVDEPVTLFVTTAINVTFPASIGLDGEVEIAIVGVPFATTIFWATVGGRDAYVESPLNVATTVYVPAVGVASVQLNKAVSPLITVVGFEEQSTA